ncbi:hypothetical protein L083_2924 [Actinoplanes sp. N902-109]|nr:hypothetical protein L083_2924 [Actinoplanes sp. N902-109]
MRPLPAQVSVFAGYGKPVVSPLTVKSDPATSPKVAISPPDARLQSVQWQLATNEGGSSNPYVTAPQAQRPVCLLLIPAPFRTVQAAADRERP